MKRLLAVWLMLTFAVVVPSVSSFAGSRYYSGHYYGGYRGHYYPTHYYPYHHGHSHYSDHFLAPFGVGLLTGAVVGSILYQPPVERTVVYSSPPPVIVHSRPVVVRPQPTYSPDPEVLRQVRPTVRILNLRSGPGLDEEVIGQATVDEILGVIGAAPEWLYVKTMEGQYGWVMTQYTQAVEGPVG